MKVRALLAALGLAIGVSGCSRVQEAALPVTAKINAAYPVSPEVSLSKQRLLSLLADEPAQTKKIESLSEARLTLRALTCSKGVVVGRFDSLAQVRRLAIDRACLQEQDRELESFYAVRLIGALLSRPALRPLKKAGPIVAQPRGDLPSVANGAVALDAGVGILLDRSGNSVVAELPGGAAISKFSLSALGSFPAPSLSPNGRLAVLYPLGQGAVFVETESGHRIWTASGGPPTRLLSWLPEVSGFILSGADGVPQLADGLTGTMRPHPLALKNSAYSSPVPGTPPRLLLGTARELVLMEHRRAGDQIDATALRTYAVQGGSGITSGHPVAMQAGQVVVYRTMNDLGWLNLDSGSSGIWRMAPRFGTSFAKLDETHIMIDSTEPGGVGMKSWSFDLTNETVAPINWEGSRGLIIDIGARTGVLRYGGDQVWFGDEVSTGSSQPLASIVADYDLQLQLSKLQGANYGGDFNRAAPAADMSSAATNAATSAAYATAAARAALAEAQAKLAPPMPVPGLKAVPSDAQVHIVGVYEGRGAAHRGSGGSGGTVRVTVRPTNQPVVLVLASYEPVNWVVVNAGARISSVLLSGYHSANVNGVGDVPLLRIGSNYAYSPNSAEYLRLRQSVQAYTGSREIRSFQGSYTGAEFSVGGH